MAFVYSCCFWFSLRLGGIIMAMFSIAQAIISIIIIYLASERIGDVKQFLLPWIENVNLSYIVNLITHFFEDPDKYLSYVTTLLSIYIIGCLLYVYGAYKIVKCLMAPYIFLELLRLIIFSFFMITSLLLLKQNTMDIGLLIGISVIVGFILLGMFYLWICAANLPILINEMKEDEQIALIDKLQKLLVKKNVRYTSNYNEDDNHKTQHKNEVFLIRRNNIWDTLPPYDPTKIVYK